MPLRTYPGRLLALSAASSALALGVSGTVAAVLYAEQSRTAEVLSEDIGSRGAAMNLDATLDTLVARHSRGAGEVGPLHEQAAGELAEVERFVNKESERELARRVRDSLGTYLGRWGAGAKPTDLADFLRADTLPALNDLRTYNGRELAASEESHRRAVGRMAWGLAAVGGLGSAGGLVFGFGLARSLRRSIQRYLVRVRGASELLGRELPAVEVEDDADGADALVRRVEQAVRRLNEQEREVRRAERLAAVGRLAAGVAHEVRNPLTSAILLLETARKDPAAGGLTDAELLLIEGELHRIERTLQTYLAFARPPKLERTACDLAAVVREAVALCRGRLDQDGVRVDVRPSADPPIPADPAQLRQVVVNLLLNAADAQPAGGTVAVSVTTADGWAELTVRDTGPGVAADMLPRLFEPFATGKETGTGLGLVVSRRIAEDHGGTLTGSNPPGGGACFVLRLPA